MPSVPNRSQVENNDNFVAYRMANIHSKEGMTQLQQRRTYLRQWVMYDMVLGRWINQHQRRSLTSAQLHLVPATQLTGNRVEEHEVLEVGDLAALPFLGHVGVPHQLPRGHHGGTPATTEQR